jgi:hypothetical protein
MARHGMAWHTVQLSTVSSTLRLILHGSAAAQRQRGGSAAVCHGEGGGGSCQLAKGLLARNESTWWRHQESESERVRLLSARDPQSTRGSGQ